MSPLEVITYGNGAILVDLFNAIARIREGNFINGIFIAMMLSGFVLSIIQNIVVFNPKAIAAWTISWSVIFGFVYQPTRTVVISDRIVGGQVAIDHIPLGLAVFSSVVSQAGSNLAEIFEDQLQLPDEVSRYTRTGTLMSSKLALSASQIQIITPNLENSFRNFAFQCIMYDVRIGSRYSMNDLLYSNDPWTLIKENTSLLRMFEYFGKNGQREVLICRAGAQRLENDLNSEAGNNAKILSWQLLNFRSKLGWASGKEENENARLNKIIKEYLPASHEILAHMSAESTEILKKHMVMNAIREAPIKNAQMLDVGAGAQGYAIARAKAQQQNTFQLLGSMAGSGVQNLMGLFEALFYGSFLIIILIAAMPGCQRVIMSYVTSLVWIQSWPTIYTIINFFMVGNATAASNAAASYIGLDGKEGIGWNLFTSPTIIQANLDQAALAGFYSLSVPFIAIAIIKGVGSFVHLAGHLSSITQGAASHAGEELTTGNYALENIQYLNTSAYGMNANHWDTAPSYRARNSTYEMASGAQMRVTGGGDTVLDQSQGISQLASNLHLGQSYANRTNEMFQEYQNAYQQIGQSFSDSVGATMSSALQYVNSGSKSISDGTNFSNSEQESNVQSLQEFDQLSDKLALHMGWSKQKSLNMLAGITASPFKYGVTNKPKKWLEKALGTKLDPTLGVNKNYSRMESASRDKFQDFVRSENASDTVEKAIRATKEMHLNMGTERQDRVSDEFSANLSNMKNHEHQFHVATQRMVSAQESNEYSESDSVNIDYNLNQKFVEWASGQQDKNGQKLGIEGVDNLLQNPTEAHEYAQTFLNEEINGLKTQLYGDVIDIEDKYTSYASEVQSDEKIRQKNESNKTIVINKANKNNIEVPEKLSFNDSPRANHEKLAKDNTEKMEKGTTSREARTQYIEKRVEDKLHLIKNDETVN